MVYTIQMIQKADSEKITINLGFVDLGQIDLLVDERFYANRSDFIRTAIRNQLRQHQAVLERGCTERQLHLGVLRLDRAMLERAAAAGAPLDLHVLGLLRVSADVDVALISRALGRVTVLGAVDATPQIRKAILAHSIGNRP